jgi:hypothetical protein
VKVFKGEASPDGRAADEVDVTCAVAHPNLIRVIGLVQQPHALVVHKVGSSQACSFHRDGHLYIVPRAHSGHSRGSKRASPLVCLCMIS